MTPGSGLSRSAALVRMYNVMTLCSSAGAACLGARALALYGLTRMAARAGNCAR